MSEVEKLRALLAEAREEIDAWGVGPRSPLVQRIDAALAEPVGPVHPSSLTDVVTLLENERDEARAEVERLRGAKPELPPRPPYSGGLPRYGLRWNGPVEPIAVPMDDGYWTPWHLADAAYQRGAEAMRDEAIVVVMKLASNAIHGDRMVQAIRALPVPEDEP